MVIYTFIFYTEQGRGINHFMKISGKDGRAWERRSFFQTHGGDLPDLQSQKSNTSHILESRSQMHSFTQM